MRSIRERLVAVTAIGCAAALAAAGLTAHVLVRDGLRRQLDADLAAEVDATSQLVEEDDGEIEIELQPHNLDFVVGRHPSYVQLWRDDGTVLARSWALGDNSLPWTPPRGQTLVRYTDVTLPGDSGRGRQATLMFIPRREAVVAPPLQLVIAVARDTQLLDAQVARLDRALLVAGALALAIVLGLIAWIGRRGLRPLDDVTAQIGAIDAGDLSARVGAEVPAELAPVVARLNELLARVETSFARERELTAELAHELRTPLAGIRATLEVALSQERAPAAYRDAIGEALAIGEQTQRLVDTLLALARLDAGLVVPRRAPVVLADLVDDVLARFTGRIAERELTVERAFVHPCEAATDEDQLRIVVWNLLDNAVSYADRGGTIAIALAQDGAVARLRVANTGSRLSPAEAARAFERFWRGDAARADRRHVGIGLALCKKIVDALDGAIALASERGGRFTATVDLPAP